MNAVGIALVWCIVQVTLLGVLAGALYLVVQKIRPGAGAAVALSGLLAVVVLSALALSPWPRWSLDVTTHCRTDFQSVPVASGGTGILPVLDGRTGETPVAPGETPVPRGEVAQPPSTLGPAVSLWRGLLDGLSQAQPAAAGTAWGWPASVAVVVLSGMAAGLVWLLLGLLAVRWHRARSRPVEDAGLVALVNQLRAELGCRRSVEFRESDDLVTAATIGWRRPCILLPRDWASWTEEQRRAVLAHELAHVRRNDFLAVLAGQLGVVLHFYHPLLHWLMGRLRLEQELAADAAAAGVSGGQRKYLVTIAELALHQQDRALAWPARTFLPTRTTFLRRITMLRDSQLRFDRLSPALKFLIVAAVAACGLLVAGLRGPNVSAPALADDAKKPAAAADDSIDTTFLSENAAWIIVMRPAAAFARPEMADLAKLLETGLNTGNVGGPEMHLSEVRQVTMISPEPAAPSGPREIMVIQWRKPLPADFVQRALAHMTAKDYGGRKIYLNLPPQNGAAVLYDDRTQVFAGSEQAMLGYLSNKRGVLPKWLPAKEWESFRGDHLVMAADAALARREMKKRAGADQAWQQAGFAPFSPIWESATFLAAGARLDNQLGIHATVGAGDADAAANVARTIEAVKVLAQNIAKNARTMVQTTPEEGRPAAVAALDAASRLLDNLKVQPEGNAVRLQSSVAVEKAWLDIVAKAAPAALAVGKQSQSAGNLKQLAKSMYEYANTHKRLPPAVLYGPDGKTPYSWRVAVLPFLGENDLYKRYRFDEPWDGPNNRKLLAEMPAVYRSPTEPPTSTNAAYFPLVGPRTAFAPGETVDFGRSFKDGASNTIMLVEAKRDIPWTKPEDIPFDPDKPVPPLGGFFEGVFLTALADASVRTIRCDIPQDILRLLIIKDDGKPIPWDKIR